ncbi:MAG: hypothetical protein ACPG4T_08520 [Nannocystaceae bacterium]
MRRFVRALYERLLIDGELSSQLALITHELLENAVKYSIDDEASLTVEVLRKESCLQISVRTSNRASRHHAERLQKIIGEVQQSDDLFGYFQELIQQTIGRSQSGLGLARIACETEMSLRLETDGDTMDIIAWYELRGESQ